MLLSWTPQGLIRVAQQYQTVDIFVFKIGMIFSSVVPSRAASGSVWRIEKNLCWIHCWFLIYSKLFASPWEHVSSHQYGHMLLLVVCGVCGTEPCLLFIQKDSCWTHSVACVNCARFNTARPRVLDNTRQVWGTLDGWFSGNVNNSEGHAFLQLDRLHPHSVKLNSANSRVCKNQGMKHRGECLGVRVGCGHSCLVMSPHWSSVQISPEATREEKIKSLSNIPESVSASHKDGSFLLSSSACCWDSQY